MEYRLDLSTLLLMLAQSTGDLRAEIQNVPKVKGRCQAFIRLERGSIYACSIQNNRNVEVISNEAAIKLIQNVVLTWNYTEDQPQTETGVKPSTTGRLQFTPTQPASPIPRRIYPITQKEFMSWSRLYRAVYSLVDGKASVNYIVTLLGQDQGPGRIIEILQHLQELGFIVIDRHS